MVYFRALVFISVKTSIVNDYFILLDIHAIIQKGEENVGFPLLKSLFLYVRCQRLQFKLFLIFRQNVPLYFSSGRKHLTLL